VCVREDLRGVDSLLCVSGHISTHALCHVSAARVPHAHPYPRPPPTTPDLRVWGLTRRPRPRPFSSKVQVSAWTESEDGKTIYIVGIEAGGREYELQKRFSDFNKLYDRVSGSCRGIEFPVPDRLQVRFRFRQARTLIWLTKSAVVGY
jgi:hypothetical protein